MKVDFHTHILPGIDDGSKDIEESISMIKEDWKQGVRIIVATPHFYADRISESHFFENRDQSEKKLRKCLARMKSVPALEIGAEVHYFRGMAKSDIIDRLTIRGTDLLLLEMPFEQWTEEHLQEIKYMIYHRNLCIILAHVERYYHFQKKKEVWDALMDLPVWKQINTGSLKKKGVFDRSYSWVIHFLKKENRVVFGTDCHNMNERRPNYRSGMDSLKKELTASRIKNFERVEASMIKRS